jgi:Domain of unknown function (DUF1963)
MNYQLNLEEWMARFPLEESYGCYSGKDITSPCDLCNNEWLRREILDEYDLGMPVPADVFVMADGEPENRFATKIGGLPYRPASEPWPTSRSGRPLNFVAQFNFTDSVDIVGQQPGDLLLVFANNDEEWFEEFHFEWRKITDDDDGLVSSLPEFPHPIAPCYGHRYRAMNYPDAIHRNPDEGYPKCKGKEVRSDYWVLQYQATQIGKAPFEPQGDNSISQLCTIASVQPDAHKRFPWVNVEQPLRPQDKWPDQGNYLMIGDLGCIFIWYDENGELTAGEQCY